MVEGLIASVLLVIIITCFLVLISHGIKSLHMLHHRHELLLDARFSRIQVMNRIRYSPVVPTLHNHGLEVRSPYHWRLGLYKYSLVTILSNGQKQDITESEISLSTRKKRSDYDAVVFSNTALLGAIACTFYRRWKP